MDAERDTGEGRAGLANAPARAPWFADPQALAWALEIATDDIDLSGYADAFLGTATAIAQSNSWPNAAYDLGYENGRRRVTHSQAKATE